MIFEVCRSVFLCDQFPKGRQLLSKTLVSKNWKMMLCKILLRTKNLWIIRLLTPSSEVSHQSKMSKFNPLPFFSPIVFTFGLHRCKLTVHRDFGITNKLGFFKKAPISKVKFCLRSKIAWNIKKEKSGFNVIFLIF